MLRKHDISEYDDESKLKAGYLLELIKLEIEDVSNSTAKYGWSNAAVLVILAPILVYFQGILQKNWESSITILDNWFAIFLCVSLLFDSFTIFAGFNFIRFVPQDIRFKFQWTNLFVHKIKVIDLIRYGLLIWIIFYKDFQVGVLVDTMVICIYGFILTFEVVKRIFNYFILIVPYYSTKRFEQAIYFFFSFFLFILFSRYLNYIHVNYSGISGNDIYTGGLICTIFYLLRLINKDKKIDYVKALEQIRQDICLQQISLLEAKKRINIIIEGMSLSETVNDLIKIPVVLLENLKSEESIPVISLKTAVNLLDKVENNIDNEASIELINKELELQYRKTSEYQKIFVVLQKYIKGKEFRLNTRLLKIYTRHFSISFTSQTNEELNEIKHRLSLLIDECQLRISDYEKYRDEFLEKLTSKNITHIFELPTFKNNLSEIHESLKIQII